VVLSSPDRLEHIGWCMLAAANKTAKTVLLVGVFASGMGIAAPAADMPTPVYKALPGAAVTSTSGIYFWMDGSAQAIRLPSLNIGFHTSNVSGAVDLGPSDPYDTQHANGFGIAGAFGYVLPYGTISPGFGSDARIELGGSYVHATVSQNSGFGPSGNNYSFVQLTGLNAGFTGCGPPGCLTSSTVSTTYDAWQVNLKGASDYRSGIFTFTPSLQGFGGSARSNESFAQQVGFPAAAPQETYNASVPLRWTDFGAKFGLDAKAALTPMLVASVGGNIGVSLRNASVTATDALTGFTVGTSQISASASNAPFLANAEARLTLSPTRAVELKGFVGLNYDSGVPGLASPTNPGPTFVVTPGSPATIKFVHETSYYAGGGLKISFGP